MATYKKPLKAFMATTLMGLSAQAMDTADGKRRGSNAIDAFKAHKTITAEDDGKKVLVPFHAIKIAHYGTMTTDAEKADAYCGGGTEPVGGVWYTVSPDSWTECSYDVIKGASQPTDIADTEALFANPNDYEVSIDDIALAFVRPMGPTTVAFLDSAESPTIAVIIMTAEGILVEVDAPCDYAVRPTVEVTVAHK